ncbi:MAG: alpha/beta hydrolase [Ginsengibacter sp.]
MSQILFQNKKFFYRVEGKGKPVMLLHGFGEDGRIWDNQVSLLQKNFLLIIPDLPGSGQSEMLDGKCSLEDYAAVIKMIAEQEISKLGEKNKFSLIGHSMGGYITLAFAQKYPELLSSIGLFHSSALKDTKEKIADRKKGIAFIKKNGTEAFLKTAIPNLFSEETKKNKPEFFPRLFDIAKSISGEALIQYYEAMILRPDRTEVLRTFQKPVLFIIGKTDPVVPLQSSLEQCYFPAISTVNVLQHSGHEGMWEEQETATIYLKEFLEFSFSENRWAK